MSTFRYTCFVIMPFAQELHYFYLYLKQYIEQTHHITCERADAQILTVPLLDKIKEYIERADVIIADCSGRNPNVFYELGMAHTLNKKVILITSDNIQDVPSDIKHYEFISYRLDNHVDFLRKLDNALHNVFYKPEYDVYFVQAQTILAEFNQSTGNVEAPASRETFLNRLRIAESRGQIPETDENLRLSEFLLFKIIDDTTYPEISERIQNWLKSRPQSHQ